MSSNSRNRERAHGVVGGETGMERGWDEGMAANVRNNSTHRGCKVEASTW